MSESTEQQILKLLESRASLIAQMELIKAEIAKQKSAILTPEIMTQLSLIDEEFYPILDAAQKGLSSLESDIRAMAVSLGKTVKSDVCTVVYNPGRRTADLDRLEDLIKRVPKYSSLLKQGDPYVTFRDKSLV